nr:hypothetical protein [Candidatus Gracilibacteria bacterium]
MKNKNKIIIGIVLSFAILTFANAETLNYKIQGITKDSDNKLNVTFDQALTASGVSGDIKVFKDLDIVDVKKDENLPSKLNITLGNDIKIGNTYNVFAVFGVDTSADFMVEDGLAVKMLSKAPETQGIVRVAFKDSKTMELYFKDSLTGSDYEFKLLEEYSVTDISTSSGSLLVTTSTPLENDSNYIFMVVSLSDNLGNEYKVNESIYDFTLGNPQINEETKNLNSASENLNVDTPQTESSMTGNLNFENGNLGNIETIANKTTQTPDTGAETWVLMLLTLIINSIYFLTRKTA